MGAGLILIDGSSIYDVWLYRIQLNKKKYRVIHLDLSRMVKRKTVLIMMANDFYIIVQYI